MLDNRQNSTSLAVASLWALSLVVLVHAVLGLVFPADGEPARDIIGGAIAQAAIGIGLGVAGWFVRHGRLLKLAMGLLAYIGLSMLFAGLYMSQTNGAWKATMPVLAIQCVLVPLYLATCVIVVLTYARMRRVRSSSSRI